eukprot:5160399-Amphidinium_carterae.1
MLAAAGGKQARGLRAVRVMPRYKDVFAVPNLLLPESSLSAGKLLDPITFNSFLLPTGSPLLDAGSFKLRGAPAPAVEEGFSRVGVFRSPFEYVCAASVKPFPTDDLELVVPSDAQSAIDFIAASSSDDLVHYRLKMFIWLRELVSRLEPDERKLHSSFHPSVEKVVQSKKVLAIREVLARVGIADDCLHHGLCEGFKLLGEIPAHTHWDTKIKLATESPELFVRNAPWRKAVT